MIKIIGIIVIIFIIALYFGSRRWKKNVKKWWKDKGCPLCWKPSDRYLAFPEQLPTHYPDNQLCLKHKDEATSK